MAEHAASAQIKGKTVTHCDCMSPHEYQYVRAAEQIKAQLLRQCFRAAEYAYAAAQNGIVGVSGHWRDRTADLGVISTTL